MAIINNQIVKAATAFFYFERDITTTEITDARIQWDNHTYVPDVGAVRRPQTSLSLSELGEEYAQDIATLTQILIKFYESPEHMAKLDPPKNGENNGQI